MGSDMLGGEGAASALDGWSAHPSGGWDAIEPSPVEAADGSRPVGIGAVCAFHGSSTRDPTRQSFLVSEFVTLADGRRLVLHSDRGFTLGASRNDSVGEGETLESLRHDVLNVVLPDDAELTGEDHPWSWLVRLAKQRGVDVTEDELRRLPYEVVIDNAVLDWLAIS